MKVIELDRSINTGINGYISLINLYNQIVASEEKEIVIDFRNTNWFEANLCSVLGAIIELSKENGYSILLDGMTFAIEKILKRNGFLAPVNYLYTNFSRETIVTFQQFKPDEDTSFNEYIKRELLSKADFPSHSYLLGKKISESIFEVFENARTHGKCALIHTCGQYYPQKKPARLDITVVDVGMTIHKNVNDYHSPDRIFTASDSIEWAIQYGNTTKKDRTGGLGLGLILEFIELNKGKIQIVSSSGYWEYQNGKSEKKELYCKFPGTIVNIEFNFDDSAFYSLKDEPKLSLDDIF